MATVKLATQSPVTHADSRETHLLTAKKPGETTSGISESVRFVGTEDAYG